MSCYSFYNEINFSFIFLVFSSISFYLREGVLKGQIADTKDQEMNGIETHDMKETKNK